MNAILIVELVIAFGLAVLFITAIVSGICRYIRRRRESRDVTEEIERNEKLLEILSSAYKQARNERKGGIYVAALSHCIQLLQNGEEIDEGAARLAIRGIEGDGYLDYLVSVKLSKKNEE